MATASYRFAVLCASNDADLRFVQLALSDVTKPSKQKTKQTSLASVYAFLPIRFDLKVIAYRTKFDTYSLV